jgi:hypothetical protein
MSDNDNVTYLKFQPKNADADAYNYFLEGAAEYAAYQDAEAMSAACMNGIIRLLERKFGKINDSINGDAAVIAVLLQGAFMRQAGVECPEIHLLDDIREALTNKGKSE